MTAVSTEQVEETKTKKATYTALSPTMVLQLAAPHTWAAAILPVLLSTVLALVAQGSVSITLVISLLIICILMQAAVNTINDYYDFVKGADSIDNQDDPTDAVLVYNNINPRSALRLALAFLGVALLIGVYVILHAGWIPLAIGLLGALIIMLYSAGKSPISYLPIGELVSGLTMGGLIPLACFYVLVGTLDLRVLLLALPIIAGIALIMFTNNTCDIEKDILAGRKTLSVLLGYKNARKWYRAILVLWNLAIIALVTVFFTSGLIIIPIMLVILYPNLSMLFNNPLKPETRGQAMALSLNLNIGLGAFYAAAILFGAYGTLIL